MPVKSEMLVRRDAFTQTAINETIAPEPKPGEVLLAVEAFAVTANNVTYAVVGEQVGYWNFFPAPEGWGIVPVWGYARVVASAAPEIAIGERVYGYLPMASHVIVQPGKISAGLFRDMAAHRQPMSSVYNQYRRLAADPAHDPAREDMRMLFEPLFLTSFLIEDTLRRAGWRCCRQPRVGRACAWHPASQALRRRACGTRPCGWASLMRRCFRLILWRWPIGLRRRARHRW